MRQKLPILATGSGTVVEHLTHNIKINSLNPSADRKAIDSVLHFTLAESNIRESRSLTIEWRNINTTSIGAIHANNNRLG